MVPEGWVEGRVSDLLNGLESGVSVNGEDRNLAVNEKAVLKVSAVSYGYFDPFAAKAIEGNELVRAKINPKKGQIIISRSNTEELVGASAFVEDDYPNLFLPDKLWQTIPKKNSDMKWLSYVLASSYSRYTLSKLATGTSGSMKNITKGELLGLKIIIPPLSEQKKIAQILSTWDKAISTTEQLLANSQQQKKALMQQLLTGKKRLLDESGVRFGGEWKRIVFGGLIKEVKKEKVNEPNAYELLTVKLHCKGVVRTGKFPNATKRGRPYFKRYAGELIIGRQNLHNGGIAIVSKECDGLIASNAISSFEVRRNSNLNFILSVMSTDNFRYRVNSLSGGTGQKEIGVKDLLSLSTKVPCFGEQQKIASVLMSANQKIEYLQQKIQVLKQEKKALMQQLLTGKKRVKLTKSLYDQPKRHICAKLDTR